MTWLNIYETKQITTVFTLYQMRLNETPRRGGEKMLEKQFSSVDGALCCRNTNRAQTWRHDRLKQQVEAKRSDYTFCEIQLHFSREPNIVRILKANADILNIFEIQHSAKWIFRSHVAYLRKSAFLFFKPNRAQHSILFSHAFSLRLRYRSPLCATEIHLT